MHLVKAIGRWAGTILLWAIVAACLAITIAPRFLDRIYYRGLETGHFDGARFFNPDGDDTARLPGGGSRAGFFTRYVLRDDGRPDWPERVAVIPGKPPARVGGGRMVATWVGHATMLVQADGINILTDPIWSDTAGPFGLGPGRVAAPGVRFEDLPRIDLVLVSHNHYDHMDLATLRRLWERDRPVIVTSLGNDTILRGAGVEAHGLDWGDRIGMPRECRGVRRCPPSIEVVVTRNHHWGSRWFTDRNRALWSSFVVRLPGGNFFFAGDTGAGDYRWADEAVAHGPVRLAALPIGAFRFEPGQMGTGSHIGPVDAVELFRRLRTPRAIGVHWGTFRLSYEAHGTPPALLGAAMACAALPGRFDTVAPGRPTEIAPYRPPRAAAPIDRAALLGCLDTRAVRALE